MPRSSKSKCYFCTAPPVYRCTWMVERFRSVPLKELEPGDVCRPWMAGFKVTIVSVEIGEAGAVVVMAYKRPEGTKREHRSEVTLSCQYSVLRPSPCGLVMCENHARDVGDPHKYCADHWRTWEQVA